MRFGVKDSGNSFVWSSSCKSEQWFQSLQKSNSSDTLSVFACALASTFARREFFYSSMSAFRCMKIFALGCLALSSVDADYRGADMVMNILSQFLANPPRTTTEREGILPKILNPLHWIPNFENIPWNPDSELTTVSRANLYKFFKHQLLTDRDCSSSRLFGRELFCYYWRRLHAEHSSHSLRSSWMRRNKATGLSSAWNSR